MFNPIIVTLDGSSYAEEILPYAQRISSSSGATLTLLRVVDSAEDVDPAREYLAGVAKRVGTNVNLSVLQGDVAGRIVSEIKDQPDALAAMTTHGRTGLLGILLGGVALNVVKNAGKPVLVYRPVGSQPKEVALGNIIVSLDGSAFSESILPYAIQLAKDLKVKITLLQVLQPMGREKARVSPSTSADELAQLVDTGAGDPDVLESSYLHGHAHGIRTQHNVEVEWEVLHGDPGDSICSYVAGRRDVILAISAHARPAVERAIFGSVTAACVRSAGVPIMVYWQ